MKKTLQSLALLVLGTLSLQSQTAVNDSVSIGSANESWYKLSNGTTSSQPRANWDLGFTTKGFDVTILFNHAIGNRVYMAMGATPATFTAVTAADTSATPFYNSDSTWSIGALNQQPSGSLNYGWGNYNTTTHNITGSRVFIIRYSDNTYKKFYIQDLNNTSVPYTYTLIYANIDNSNQQTATIQKQTYGTKNFIYYSLSTNAIVDREPATTDWDLLFTKYTSTSETYMGSPNQVVAGTLQNSGVLAAQANSVTAATYTNYAAHTFSTTANVLGWDWKGLNASFQYTVEPSRVYFVKTKDNSIYKLVFISYTGSTSGKFKFSKELMPSSTTSIDEAGNAFATVSLYPNPTNEDNTTILFSSTKEVENVTVSVLDITGKLVSEDHFSANEGLNQHILSNNGLQPGVYFIRLNAGNHTMTQKLIKY